MKRKHKWWHFVFGTKLKMETVYKRKNFETSNCWWACRKCGRRVGEIWGSTTFTLPTMIIEIPKKKKRK